MTWTYTASSIATSKLFQIRRMIGDVLPGDQQMQDEEINYISTLYSNNWMIAAECCRNIAAQFSRKVDTVQGELRTLYAQQSKNYDARARKLEQLGLSRSATPYAGGISITDKTNNVNDSDRVPPQFNIGMDDNLLPVGPVGNQTPTPGSPEFEPIDIFPV